MGDFDCCANGEHAGEPLSDEELMAVFDAAYNLLDDGTVRVRVLELAGLRAVYEAGRNR